MCTKNCTYSFWQKFILCEEARLMKVWVIVPVLWMRQKNVNINTLMMNISRTLYVCSKRQWGTINLDYRFLTLAWTAYDAKRTDASGEQNISSSNICFLTYTGDWRQVWTQTNHVKLFKNTKANATYQNKSAKKKSVPAKNIRPMLYKIISYITCKKKRCWVISWTSSSSTFSGKNLARKWNVIGESLGTSWSKTLMNK